MNRAATLRLHLGEPARARELWQKAAPVPPQSAIRDARIGASYLVENDFEAARRYYRQALAAKPDLFEAHYGLAVLEQDSGNAAAALEAARAAVRSAPDDAASSAARVIAARVAPYARHSSAAEGAGGRELPASTRPDRLP